MTDALLLLCVVQLLHLLARVSSWERRPRLPGKKHTARVWDHVRANHGHLDHDLQLLTAARVAAAELHHARQTSRRPDVQELRAHFHAHVKSRHAI